jgi:hypothetical protein
VGEAPTKPNPIITANKAIFFIQRVSYQRLRPAISKLGLYERAHIPSHQGENMA